MAEADVAKFMFGGFGQLLEPVMHDGELTRRRALEGENRLLLVADREDRPSDQARAGAGEKFGGEAGDDFPLLRARILRLVDQHVVDALIELVVHPGRPLLAQQRQGLFDQVVVIEVSAPVLRRLVAGDHGIGDGDERRGAVAAGHRVAARDQRQHALALAAEALGKPRIVGLDRPGDELLAGLELAGEEELTIDAGALRPGGCERGVKPAGLFLIALGAAREHLGGGRPLRGRKQRPFRHLVLDALDRVVGADAERPAERGDRRLDATAVVDPGAHGVALADRFTDHVLEGLVGHGRDRGRERAAERAFG